jgi:type IV pilus assembly protein PilE
MTDSGNTHARAFACSPAVPRAPGAQAGPPRRRAGLTLLEFLSGLIVVAIIVAIAVPAYRNHVLRAQRRDAKAALLAVQAAEDKFLLQHGQYCERLTAAPPLGLGLPGRSARGYYAVGVHFNPDPSTYLARAIPIVSSSIASGAHAVQPRDATCRAFAIDQNGLKSAQDESGADSARECWR